MKRIKRIGVALLGISVALIVAELFAPRLSAEYSGAASTGYTLLAFLSAALGFVFVTGDFTRIATPAGNQARHRRRPSRMRGFNVRGRTEKAQSIGYSLDRGSGAARRLTKDHRKEEVSQCL